MTSPQIFISYRRKEASAYALLLRKELGEVFGENAIFQDIHSLHFGIDFRKEITEAVASCKVLIAVIGPQWQDRLDEKKSQPLEASDDVLRLEIAAALKRGIPVVPLLLPGATTPDPDELPPDLKELAYRNAIDTRNVSWDEDVARLAEKLKPYVKNEEVLPPATPRDWRMILSIVGMLALLTVAGVWFIRNSPAGANQNDNRGNNNPNGSNNGRPGPAVSPKPNPTEPRPTATNTPGSGAQNPNSTLEGTNWSGEAVVEGSSVPYRFRFLRNDRVDWMKDLGSSEPLIGNYTVSQDNVTMTFKINQERTRVSPAFQISIELKGTITGNRMRGSGNNSDGLAWQWVVNKEAQ
jgi:hypothetical protein